MSPEGTELLARLRPYANRLRAADVARLALLAAGASGGTLVLLSFVLSPGAARMVAAVLFAAVLAIGLARRRRRWTLPRVAAAIEASVANADNTIVAAEEIASGRGRRPHPTIGRALFDAAAQRLDAAPPAMFQPLARVAALAIGASLAVVVLAATLPAKNGLRPEPPVDTSAGPSTPLSVGDLRVVVTPPAYLRQPPFEAINPTSITAIEGSRVRLESGLPAENMSVLDAGGGPKRFEATSHGSAIELQAMASGPLLVQHAGGGAPSRLIDLRVDPDGRPLVRIDRPARDLVFPDAAGTVPIEIEARDDFALEAVSLRYTRVSGTGETFTFEEGEWPLETTRDAANRWRARASLTLDRLKLGDGDTLIYRAVARDARPGADPSASDSFLIEIGRLAGVAATGFALPEDRDRQALSQQMLIIKTERLHASRGSLGVDALLEGSRLLAVEQRMVKAEFVFMTGGEVADEVEEAEHAHELAEGRLENSAQIELLNAIREMSRAEARLNAGDTAQALEFERAALKALQRAFDRRRYLLRTLPERTRIDPARRLSGELATARSSSAPAAAEDPDSLTARARQLLVDLARANADEDLSRLAARLLALDPEAPALRTAALQLSAARDSEERTAARAQAADALVQSLGTHLPAAARPPLNDDPVRGLLAEELRRMGKTP